MSNISVWDAVAGGSTLEFSVKGKTKKDVNFIADARVVPTKGKEFIVPDHDMNPGPKVLQLKSGTSYAIRLAVKFLGSTGQNAVIKARLLDPNGNAMKNLDGISQYSFAVSGKAGDPIRRATLVSQTL